MVSAPGGVNLAEIKAVYARLSRCAGASASPMRRARPSARSTGAPQPGTVWIGVPLAGAHRREGGRHAAGGPRPARGRRGDHARARQRARLLRHRPARADERGGPRRHRPHPGGQPRDLSPAGRRRPEGGGALPRARWRRMLGRGERIEGVRDARSEVRTALDRAQRFLGLASLLSVVLASVAVALAARRFSQRQMDAAAMMRCLGATQARPLRDARLAVRGAGNRRLRARLRSRAMARRPCSRAGSPRSSPWPCRCRGRCRPCAAR